MASLAVVARIRLLVCYFASIYGRVHNRFKYIYISFYPLCYLLPYSFSLTSKRSPLEKNSLCVI